MNSFLKTSARLTASMTLTLLVFGCGGGGGKKLTPEQATAAGAMCNRAKECGLVSSSQMQQCKEQIAGALQIFPDPDAFAACVQTMTCAELEEGDEEKIKTCTDWNYDTIKCSTENFGQAQRLQQHRQVHIHQLSGRVRPDGRKLRLLRLRLRSGLGRLLVPAVVRAPSLLSSQISGRCQMASPHCSQALPRNGGCVG